MKDHDGDFRGFYHLSEAWYGSVNLQNSLYTVGILPRMNSWNS